MVHDSCTVMWLKRFDFPVISTLITIEVCVRCRFGRLKIYRIFTNVISDPHPLFHVVGFTERTSNWKNVVLWPTHVHDVHFHSSLIKKYVGTPITVIENKAIAGLLIAPWCVVWAQPANDSVVIAINRIFFMLPPPNLDVSSWDHEWLSLGIQLTCLSFDCLWSISHFDLWDRASSWRTS